MMKIQFKKILAYTILAGGVLLSKSCSCGGTDENEAVAIDLATALTSQTWYVGHVGSSDSIRFHDLSVHTSPYNGERYYSNISGVLSVGTIGTYTLSVNPTSEAGVYRRIIGLSKDNDQNPGISNQWEIITYEPEMKFLRIRESAYQNYFDLYTK